MSAASFIWTGIVFVVGPFFAYYLVKFGTAGFYRAKERERQRRQRVRNAVES